MQSPYSGKPLEQWKAITKELINNNPLDKKEIVTIILQAWDCIFQSKICGLQIGKEIFPNPQMMGYFVETVTASLLTKKYPTIWKHGTENKTEKDVVCLLNNDYSIEIKCSSSKKIYGNRSYAQEQSATAQKSKDSFYLAINFEKFLSLDGLHKPDISLIQLGYVEHSDWRGQKSEKGQQASLSPDVYKNKFITLYEKEKTKTIKT